MFLVNELVYCWRKVYHLDTRFYCISSFHCNVHACHYRPKRVCMVIQRLTKANIDHKTFNPQGGPCKSYIEVLMLRGTGVYSWLLIIIYQGFSIGSIYCEELAWYMFCHLVSAKPLCEPILSIVTSISKSESKYISYEKNESENVVDNRVWKCPKQNSGHIVSTSLWYNTKETLSFAINILGNVCYITSEKH